MIIALRSLADHLAALASCLLLAFVLSLASHAGQPVTCHFDGGGTSAAGSVTATDDGHLWLCTDDGYLIPWHG